MNKKLLTIKHARKQNIPEIKSLLLDLVNSGSLMPSEACQFNKWGNTLNEPQKAHLFVAMVNGKIIGICKFQQIVSVNGNGPIGLVKKTLVHEDFVSQKIETQFTSALKAWARSRGHTKIKFPADGRNLAS